MVGPVSFRLYFSLRLFNRCGKSVSQLLSLLLPGGLSLPSLNVTITPIMESLHRTSYNALHPFLHHLTSIALNLSSLVSCGKKLFKTKCVPPSDPE